MGSTFVEPIKGPDHHPEAQPLFMLSSRVGRLRTNIARLFAINQDGFLFAQYLLDARRSL
jgi:hypothetical protein